MKRDHECIPVNIKAKILRERTKNFRDILPGEVVRNSNGYLLLKTKDLVVNSISRYIGGNVIMLDNGIGYGEHNESQFTVLNLIFKEV